MKGLCCVITLCCLQKHQQTNKPMFDEELKKRKEFSYPPFYRFIHLTFKHKLKEVVEKAAYHYTDALKMKYGSYIVGPAEPVVCWIRNQYLNELLIKLPRDGKTITQCKRDLLEQIAILHQNKSFRIVTILADVDAV